jgi:hypothetical protein
MKRRTPGFLSLAILLAGAGLAFAAAPSARAQDIPNGQTGPDNSNVNNDIRVARLSFAMGDVQYQRPNEDRQPATANLPIEQGFHLKTGNGRAEVQFESGAIVRLAENSELEFSKLTFGNDGRVTELSLIQGSVEITADTKNNDSLAVDAPGMHVTAPHSARFRMDTTQGDSWASVMKGDVQVSTNSGETRLSTGHTLHISGGNGDHASIELNAPLDDFDRWASSRDQLIEQGYSQALQYVAPLDTDYQDYSYGISDLSDDGYWTDLPGYGYCWQPYGAGAGWAPFYYGSWIYLGHHHHWTWVSNEPWGWLPYHTGRWINAGGRGWAWQPGSSKSWDPAPVNWLRVGNQIAWAPAGTFNGKGVLSATGIVTGTLDPRGIVIKASGKIPPAPETFAKSAPAPSAPAHSTLHSGIIAPMTGTITYDAAAHAYMNTHPVDQQNPGNAPAGVDNPAVPAQGSTFTGGQVNTVRPDSSARPTSQPRPAYVAPAAHEQQPRPATPAAPRYISPQPQQHYSAPAPTPHYSAPPASHGGGGSSGHH